MLIMLLEFLFISHRNIQLHKQHNAAYLWIRFDSSYKSDDLQNQLKNNIMYNYSLLMSSVDDFSS